MKTNDGHELTGTEPRELVTELRRISVTQTHTNAEFMAQSAARALAQTGQRVRCDTADNFVADLLEVGLLTED